MSDTFNSLCPNCASDLIPGDPVCPECGITMDGMIPSGEAGSAAGGDQISAGNISDAQGVAIGRGAQAVRVDDVTGTLIQAQRLVQSSIFTNSTITIQQQAQAGGMRRASKFQIFPPADFYVPRAEFEERLADLLKHRSDGLNVVGLYGLPGVGSSMMVRKVASGMKDEFPDGMLWVDVEDKSEVDVLWGLIEPYETPAERSPFRDGRHYLGDLQGILADKRVLIVLDQVRPENGEVVSKVLPRGCAGVCVLLVSSTPLPGLFREENSVCLQELMPDEAEQLFRNIWRGSFSATTSEVVRAMAGELGYLPTQIVLVARDIINRQIAPQDYLEELRRQKKERQLTVASENPGLQTVYENLPAKGRDIFPYIGVVGASGWTLEDLVTVSQLKRHEVEVGLRQLVLAGFLRGDIEGGYRCSPVVRRFALSLLLDIGGEALVQSCYAVLARHILRQARETSRLFRQSILDDYLNKPARQELFKQALDQSFLPAAIQGRPGDSVPLRSRPGLADNDVIQEVFERVVLADADYFRRWAELLGSQLCLQQRSHLEEALAWAIEKEDWSLVRRFATLSMSAMDTSVNEDCGDNDQQTISINEFGFGPMRGCIIQGGQLDSNLVAVRMIEPKIENCEMISTRWSGVHLYRPMLSKVDMVSAAMPGLVVRDGTFVDVDARGADLRGAIFYNCFLEGINFRSTDLSGADFINCRGSKIDLRSANLQGTTFVSTTFTKVTYYEADRALFARVSASQRLAGRGK